jgi:hypothetical protein
MIFLFPSPIFFSPGDLPPEPGNDLKCEQYFSKLAVGKDGRRWTKGWKCHKKWTILGSAEAFNDQEMECISFAVSEFG